MIKKPILFLFFSLLILNSAYSYIRVSPTVIFIDEPKRSNSINVINVTDIDVEIWVEKIFGYVANDDSGNVIIIQPDIIENDDISLVNMITIYPEKFILKPGENQFIRFIVNTTSKSTDGEYWARIIVNSKPLEKKLKATSGKPDSPKIGIEIVNQQSIPIHYRKGKVNTSVEIINQPHISIEEKEIIFNADFRRFGNSSYWGVINFELADIKGRVVKKHTQNLVVYKEINLKFKVDISDVPKGDYFLNTSAETKRLDDASKFIIKAEIKQWKYPIRIF